MSDVRQLLPEVRASLGLPTYGPGKPVPAYGERDLAAAYAVIDLAVASPTLLAREIAGAVAGARREGGEAALAPFRELFSGESENSGLETTWRHGRTAFAPRGAATECVEVPRVVLEKTLGEVDRAIRDVA